jgi:hypothetical protein
MSKMNNAEFAACYPKYMRYLKIWTGVGLNLLIIALCTIVATHHPAEPAAQIMLSFFITSLAMTIIAPSLMLYLLVEKTIRNMRRLSPSSKMHI